MDKQLTIIMGFRLDKAHFHFCQKKEEKEKMYLSIYIYKWWGCLE